MIMQLTSLTLENFRNYDSLTLDLEKAEVIALVGQNAQGKTNFLESIAFLALGKSFRARQFLETLKWDRPHGRIRATLKGSKHETDLELFMSRTPQAKKVKKNQKLVKPKDFLGTFRVVLFTPDTLLMVGGSPSLRRQFFDRLLIQLDREYFQAFSNYQRSLKQRNALLKRIQARLAELWELDMWDATLVTEANKIWEKRLQFTDYLSQHIKKHYQEISGTQQSLSITYKPTQENFEEKLVAARSQDIRTGTTSLGPHRDDFTLHLQGHPLAETGSRGECRSAILSLKMAEIHFVEEKTKEKPLLLLDDVFSELDESRQKHLGKLLKGHQSIITTTEEAHLSGLSKVKILKVEMGRVTN